MIVRLRQLGMTAAEIAETLAMPLLTVSAILRQRGMERLGRIGLEPPVRYEHSRPGELVHIDVKKLGRIDGGAGKRVGDRTPGRYRPRRSDTAGVKRGTTGWEYVHVAVDVECPRFVGQLSAATGISRGEEPKSSCPAEGPRRAYAGR
jgi:hypothetical protein